MSEHWPNSTAIDAVPKFGGSYIGQDRSTRPCFHLPKRETLILVSGYSMAMRAGTSKKWRWNFQPLLVKSPSPQF